MLHCMENHFKSFFIYSTPPVALPDGGSSICNISISKDASFFCEGVRIESTSSCAVVIHDCTEGRWWSNIPTHSNVWNSWKPNMPRFIAAGGTISVDIANFEGGGINTIQVSFVGHKDFSRPMPITED